MLLQIFKTSPILRFLISYILGILFLSDNLRLIFCLLVFALWAAVANNYFVNKLASGWNVRWMPGLSLVCIWMAIGGFVRHFESLKSEYPEIVCLSENTRFDGKLLALARVESNLSEKKNSYQMQVSVLKSENPQWNGRSLILYIAKGRLSSEIRFGDRLKIRMRPFRPYYKSDSTGFDYGRWLRNKGICATAYVGQNDWKMAGVPSEWNLKALASKCRRTLVERFGQAGITGEKLAIASAMSIGYRNDFDKNLSRRFSVAGITHVLSVSGLHVAVVFSMFQLILSVFGLKGSRKLAGNIICIFLIWVYAFLTGLSPSVNRSALMLTLFSIGNCIGRKAQTINTVFFSAFLLLLFNPNYIYDLGFQLSYLSVIAIVIVYPEVRLLWRPTSKITGYFWDMMSLSAVAQIATAPLTMSCFGQFPNYFLINNIVAVPLSGLIIYLSTAYLALSFIPLLSDISAKCLDLSLQFFLWFIGKTSSLPFAVTEGIRLDKSQVLVLYVLLLLVFGWQFLKHKKWLPWILACIVIFQIQVLYNYYENQIKVDFCETMSKMYLCEKNWRC